MKLHTCGIGLVLFALLAESLVGGADSPSVTKDLANQTRRPIALVLLDDQWLFVANQRSGTISTIDVAGGQLIAETYVGRSLADLVATPDGRALLAVDEEANELIVFARSGKELKVSARVPVADGPVSVVAGKDSDKCFVASLWPRLVTLIDLGGERSRAGATIAVPFAPRKMALARTENKLIVADSFGGGLAVIDVVRGRVESFRSLPAHNIRGLAVMGPSLVLAHQNLDRRAATTRDNIHWGNLLTNSIRTLPLDAVCDPAVDPLLGGKVYPLGELGRGAGDPSGLAVGPDGLIAVSLGGVGELMWGRGRKVADTRLTVGQRPTAVALSSDGRRAYVADTFGDAIAVVDLEKQKTVEISLGPAPRPTSADRGEMLFYDARLSFEGWLSCHSCHTDGHTNGRLADNFSDGSFDTPKRVLSLLGTRDTGPWAWNGKALDLESQIKNSVVGTMQGEPVREEQMFALMAYLQTLKPPPPAEPATKADQEQLRRGKAVFERESCVRCHAPPDYTTSRVYDVGLADEKGLRLFNPPSLRGVGHGGPFFHDNRAADLREVFTKYRHRLQEDLTEQELSDLLGFLRSL